MNAGVTAFQGAVSSRKQRDRWHSAERKVVQMRAGVSAFQDAIASRKSRSRPNSPTPSSPSWSGPLPDGTPKNGHFLVLKKIHEKIHVCGLMY